MVRQCAEEGEERSNLVQVEIVQVFHHALDENGKNHEICPIFVPKSTKYQEPSIHLRRHPASNMGDQGAHDFLSMVVLEAYKEQLVEICSKLSHRGHREAQQGLGQREHQREVINEGCGVLRDDPIQELEGEVALLHLPAERLHHSLRHR